MISFPGPAGRSLAALCCVVVLAGAARAQNVDLELVLAVDASGSIDDREFALQREGYARALMHADVLAAIAGGPHRAIAVTFIEWSGPDVRALVVPWTRITGAASAAPVTTNSDSPARTGDG